MTNTAITSQNDIVTLESAYDAVMNLHDKLLAMSYRHGDAGRTAIDAALTTASDCLAHDVAYHIGAVINALHEVALTEREGA